MSRADSSKFVVVAAAAAPRRQARRSPRDESALVSGFLYGFLVDHLVVTPVNDWLLLPTNHAEEEDDEEEEQRAGHRQTDDHF